MVRDEVADNKGGEAELELEVEEVVAGAGAGTETARLSVKSITADIHLPPQTFTDQTRTLGTTLT